VENQSFFYIEEKVDHKVLQEKSSIAIISVLSGQATARQIEEEFKHVVEGSNWRWTTRPIASNKFSMRFPDARLVQVYYNFTSLVMKAADAQIVVTPWSVAANVKGKLQQGWFRIKGIPVDQRSIRTITNVAGLVGKAIDIDEATRTNSEYVRVQIACREVTKVPVVAEGTLGLMIYDFSFEREMEAAEGNKMEKIPTKNHESGGPPSPKRPRVETPRHVEKEK
jgi:hypothetical protein